MESFLKSAVNRNRVKRCRPMLGTFVDVSVESRADTVAMHQWVNEAFTLVEKVHRMMSFQESQSDLSKLNAAAFHEPVPVHAWLWNVLQCSYDMGLRSGGSFDVAYGSPDNGSFRDIVFHPDQTITFRKPLSVDLGGIAKGFAVDVATELLARHPFDSVCVNAGGDLRFWGEMPATVDVRDPQRPREKTRRVPLTHSAVATSAPYFRRGGDEIVRPGNSGGAVTYSSVTVFADTCMVADALTKVVVLDGPEKAFPVLALYGANMLTYDPVSA